MNTATIARLNDLDDMKRQAEVDYMKKIKRLDKEINRLRATCDHAYPNGKSAIIGGIECNMCQICHWSDYY